MMRTNLIDGVGNRNGLKSEGGGVSIHSHKRKERKDEGNRTLEPMSLETFCPGLWELVRMIGKGCWNDLYESLREMVGSVL